jgi:hypothetical protein
VRELQLNHGLLMRCVTFARIKLVSAASTRDKTRTQLTRQLQQLAPALGLPDADHSVLHTSKVADPNDIWAQERTPNAFAANSKTNRALWVNSYLRFL